MNKTWIAKAEIAALLGMTERGFDKCVRPLVLPKATRKAGKRLEFDAPQVLKAWRDHSIEMAVPDEGMLSPAAQPSPALERYREERANLAKLERMEREGSLVRREYAQQIMGRLARHIRAAGDALKREYGNGAWEILDDAIAEAEREGDSL